MTGAGRDHAHAGETVGGVRARGQIRLTLPPSTGLTVVDGAGRRSAHHHACLVGTPSKVDTVTEERKGGIKSVEPAPRLQPDEHPSRRSPQDGAGISLLLVNVTAVNDGKNPSTAGTDTLALLVNELGVIVPSRLEQGRVQDVRVRLARSLMEQ